MTVAAEMSWPEAALAIAGTALVGVVVVVVILQAMALWRARVIARERERRSPAEQTVHDLNQPPESHP